jgi:DNA invertase Pin-like site-specific DNA recombinase
MTRVAIYARYSSELQHERSIDDQLALCRDFAARRNWTVTITYADRAISGASIHGRHEFQRMQEDARDRRFDILLAEDIDRLARNQADGARLFERLAFLSIPIWTIADGETNEMHWGLKGTMSALFLKTHALKVRRGQAGRVRAGRIPGGLCYGYRVVRATDAAGEFVRGEREIAEAEAEVVRRIFHDTIAGLTAREIAAALNREGVPAPRGGTWNASTINGSKKRGNGILRQHLYAGRLVWNRQHFIKDPDTGKRVTRVNAEGELHFADVPQLRIIEEADWQRVQKIMAGKSSGSGGPKKRKSPHLFTGLMKCGQCGRSYVSGGGSEWPRFICAGRREAGICDNNRMISARIVEQCALGAIERDLLDDRVVAEAVREYAAERKRLKASRLEADRRRSRRLGEVERAVKNLIALVESGADPQSVMPRLKQLEAERERLQDEGKGADSDVIEIHPGVADYYRTIVRDLRAALAERSPEQKREVLASVRSLVEKIVIYPSNDPQGRDLELVGQLAALFGRAKLRSGMRRVVAEDGFEPPTHGL